MAIIQNERIIPCDVDDTIIMHCKHSDYPESRRVSIPDPIDTTSTLTVVVNEPMVRLIREEIARGAFVMVWSRGGYAWAAAVVEAVGLTDIIPLIMSKPLVYFDDKPVEQWLKDRVYLEPDANYKNMGSNTLKQRRYHGLSGSK